MSLTFPFSEIEKYTEEIKKYLIITPKQKSHTEYASQEPVKFYEIFAKDGIKYIKLPYFFTRCIFKKDLFNVSHSLEVSKFIGELREEQVEIFKQAYDQITTKKTTSLFLSTGTGKTFLSSYMTYKLKCITLILIHLKTLAGQWALTYLKNMPEIEDNILVVCDELNDSLKFMKKCKDPKVIICTVGSTHKIPENILKTVELLIIDEGQCFTSQSRVKGMLCVTNCYIMVNTATPDSKEDGTYDGVKMLVGNHFVKYERKKEMDVFIFNTGIVFENKNGYVNLVTELSESPERNEFIIKLIEANLDRKIMVVCYRKKHCELLYNTLKDNGHSVALLYEKVSSYKDAKILIVSYSKGSIGFDEETKCENFIGHSDLLIDLGTHAKIAPFKQLIGRVRISNPFIVFLNDRHSTINSHMTEMRKWCKELNSNIYEIKYKEDINLNLKTHKESQTK